jgi:hypothetical protein
LGLKNKSKVDDLLLFESIASFSKILETWVNTCFDEIRIMWVLGFMKDVMVKYVLVINIVIG